MPEPYNYLANLPNPAAQITGGLTTGMGLAHTAQQMSLAREQADMMAQYRAAQIEQEQAQTAKIRSEMERQQAFQGEVAKLAKEGFTTSGLVDVMARFPDMAKQLEKPYEALGAEQRKQSVEMLQPVVAALNSGDRVNAAMIMDEKIDALRNAGKEREAAEGERQRDMILHGDLNAAQTRMNSALAIAMGPEKYKETFGALEDERRKRMLESPELAKKEAEARRADFEATIKGTEAQFAPQMQKAELGVKQASASNMYSQISERSKRLNLDERKFADESARAWANLGLDRAKLSQLPDAVRKEVDGYVVKAGEASTYADKMNNLADKFESTVKTGGLRASIGELFAGATGREDEVSRIRSEYARLRNTQVLKNLPPGPASDKDIAFAAKGFPSETANPTEVATFLRGMAKLQKIDSLQNEARAAWTSSFRGLGNATEDTSVGGIQVRAGEKFNDFAKRYLEGATPTPQAAQAPAAAPAADVRSQADAILRGGK